MGERCPKLRVCFDDLVPKYPLYKKKKGKNEKITGKLIFIKFLILYLFKPKLVVYIFCKRDSNTGKRKDSNRSSSSDVSDKIKEKLKRRRN